MHDSMKRHIIVSCLLTIQIRPLTLLLFLAKFTFPKAFLTRAYFERQAQQADLDEKNEEIPGI